MIPKHVAIAAAGLLAGTDTQAASRPDVVVWAWNRPEDLRFLPGDVAVAAYAGDVLLSGDRVRWQARRFPLRLPPGTRPQAVVHVQIAPGGVHWSPVVRARTRDAVLRLAAQPGYRGLQIDFEVPASKRQLLVDLIGDVRKALPPGTFLSMTALASWCMTERWLGPLPVDEVVPMLFRMGQGGAGVTRRLAEGGDFAEPACRRALALSSDAPLRAWPRPRIRYLFHPRSWTAAALAAHQGRRR